MKFSVPVPCASCGRKFQTTGYGESEFPPAACPACKQTIFIIDPLTFSIVAARLLHRAYAELENGDFTMPILCGAMAVESALTSLFLKWWRLEYRFSQDPVSDLDRKVGEREYRNGTKRGGFANSANFVSRRVSGKQFDEFAADYLKRSNKTAIIGAGLPELESQVKTDYIHRELFQKRNPIMHWGEVNYEEARAVTGIAAARTAFALLTVMDKEKASEFQRTLGIHRIRAVPA